MDLNYLKKITKILAESNLDELELEEEGLKLRLVKNKNNAIHNVPVQQPIVQAVPVQQIESKFEERKPEEKTAIHESKIYEIRSPIVGTFYGAPSPDASPYVEVGQMIQKGTVLCIIEAMKLMNEIESDVSGRIVKIMVEDAQAVEYNQVLFLVELT